MCIKSCKFSLFSTTTSDKYPLHESFQLWPALYTTSQSAQLSVELFTVSINRVLPLPLSSFFFTNPLEGRTAAIRFQAYTHVAVYTHVDNTSPPSPLCTHRTRTFDRSQQILQAPHTYVHGYVGNGGKCSIIWVSPRPLSLFYDCFTNDHRRIAYVELHRYGSQSKTNTFHSFNSVFTSTFRVRVWFNWKCADLRCDIDPI